MNTDTRGYTLVVVPIWRSERSGFYAPVAYVFDRRYELAPPPDSEDRP